MNRATQPPRLLFVYNADSGLFNTLGDIGHKIFSPSTYACQLCALSHGYFSMRKEWQEFLDSLACEPEFLHRDEFRQRYPDLAIDLPAILIRHDDAPAVLLDRASIEACADLPALQGAIRTALAADAPPATRT